MSINVTIIVLLYEKNVKDVKMFFMKDLQEITCKRKLENM